MKNRRIKARKTSLSWRVPALLHLLGSINILSGAFRLGQIQQGPTPNTEEGIIIYIVETILWWERQEKQLEMIPAVGGI